LTKTTLHTLSTKLSLSTLKTTSFLQYNTLDFFHILLSNKNHNIIPSSNDKTSWIIPRSLETSTHQIVISICKRTPSITKCSFCRMTRKGCGMNNITYIIALNLIASHTHDYLFIISYKNFVHSIRPLNMSNSRNLCKTEIIKLSSLLHDNLENLLCRSYKSIWHFLLLKL